MEEQDSKKELNTIICRECKAELPEKTKFCTECGKPTETTNAAAIGSDETILCPSCGAEVEPENNFCKECWNKIGETDTPEATETAPETTSQITTCPKCFASLKPGNKFCIECGVNVQEYKAIESELKESRSKKSSPDQTMDELQKTGEGLMKEAEKIGGGLIKEVGGFLGKKNSSSSKKTIKPHKKGERFLVCKSCGGYYQLAEGEEPEDFDDACECGGKLRVSDSKSL